MYDLQTMDKRLIIFGYLFRVANRLQSKMDAQMQDLTAKQWFVLLALGLFDQPPTLSQLAAVCDTSHQNTKQILRKLEEKGYVTMESDGKDGRVMRIALTAKSHQWDKDNEENAHRFVEDMFAGVGPQEVAGFCGSLLTIYDNLDHIDGGESQ